MRSGPVMLDLAATQISAEEREILCHPRVGGVILFSRNFSDLRQLTELVDQIHALRDPPLLVTVDHEGGRVQRFRDGFTRLPSMASLGRMWGSNAAAALEAAANIGFVLAAELRSCGIDLSFAPVLDLDFGRSTVIGDRAFDGQPEVVAKLAGALIDGLHAADMRCVGKHFPGHGYVEADSHVAIPVDDRSFDDIWAHDIQPYVELGARVDAVMPAHVIYRTVDERPAGFSPFWIGDVLRRRLGFDGVVFSDDLSMEGASVAGDVVDRAQAAWEAGCDMVLVCNAPSEAVKLLDRWTPQIDAVRSDRLLRLLPRGGVPERGVLATDARHVAGREAAARLLG